MDTSACEITFEEKCEISVPVTVTSNSAFADGMTYLAFGPVLELTFSYSSPSCTSSHSILNEDGTPLSASLFSYQGNNKYQFQSDDPAHEGTHKLRFVVES